VLDLLMKVIHSSHFWTKLPNVCWTKFIFSH